jgi:hypothetical protein
MNIFKSHFWHNKRQRNGIFFLVLLIILLQFVFSLVNFSSDALEDINPLERIAFQKQIDSLKAIEIEKRKPKIFPFNPNYITDYKGEQLGMSILEIDGLLMFRKTGKFVNSKREFQQVTKVSDSLLRKISSYFKFPDWVVERNRQQRKVSVNNVGNNTPIKSREEVSTTDLNIENSIDFQFVAVSMRF